MLLYVLLTLPVSFLESAYRNFYMGISRAFFKEIHGTGFVRFLTDKNPSITHLQVGNTAIRQSDGTGRAALTDVNTRIRGYLPTALLFSLILAGSLAWKRKLTDLLLGFTVITLFVMFKQWIHILYVYSVNSYLNLYSFGSYQKKVIEFGYENLITTVGPSLFVVLLIWLILTLRGNSISQLLQAEKNQTNS